MNEAPPTGREIAIDRVLRMQQQAAEAVARSQGIPPPEASPLSAAPPSRTEPFPGLGNLFSLLQGKGKGNDSLSSLLHRQVDAISAPLAGLLDGLGIDGERLVILLVLWVLLREREEENSTLLLALGYLLL